MERGLKTGLSREHSHRPALIRLVESYAHGYDVTNEPRRSEYGAPDIIVTRNRLPIGYFETKDIGKDLDEFLETDQLVRYLKGLPNFIFTNYLEFRWYVKGEQKFVAEYGTLSKDGKTITLTEGGQQLDNLLEQFIKTEIPSIASPKELAASMAGIAKQIRYSIDRVFKNEPEGKGSLHDQLKGFREVLLHDLSYSDFADMYAQTICYGLFAAKCTAKVGEQFTRDTAARQLPKTNPFLRKMFAQIAGPELDDRIAWSVDELVSLLNHTKIHSVMEDFGKRTKRRVGMR